MKSAERERKIIDGIAEATLVQCSIDCEKCGGRRVMYGIDDYDFAIAIRKEGWTFKRGRVLCDACNDNK